MGKKKKPFIDKRNAHSYKLVHRSQRDPLIVDEETPKFVLKPLDQQDDKQRQQHLHGIHFDDDYDYLQHLRSVDYSSSGLELVEKHQRPPRLPSEVFPSEHEEDVGMLNKAAPLKGPRPDWDPDIVATLDDDYEHCNSLDDDFVDVANGPPSDGSHDEFDDTLDLQNKLPVTSYDSDDDVSAGSCDHQWETKSRFTEYSITSSVVPRSKGISCSGLELLDEKFEQFYAQYDDDEFGSSSDDNDSDDAMANEHDKHLLDQAVEDFENDFKVKCKIPTHDDTESKVTGSHDLSSEEELIEVSEDCHENQWDCESILSTYSNLYNHPVTISDPKPIKINKQGIPLNVLRDKKMHNGEFVDATEQPEVTKVTPMVIRHKGETKEEKQARKHLVKQHNKQRRVTKKATQQVYKNEELRQKKLYSKPQSSIVVL